jgi:hypothetical protein
MRRFVFAGMIVAFGLLAAACGGGDEVRLESTASPSPTPSQFEPSPTASEAVTPEPTVAEAASAPSPSVVDQPKLIFVRDTPSVFPTHGVLWVANLDGSEEQRLSPAGVEASFAGTVGSKSGGWRFFYITRDSETDRTLWRKDLQSGDTDALFEFISHPAKIVEASISPDGVYAAYTHGGGISLLDLARRDSRPLVGADFSGCATGPAGCGGYIWPNWSPDGRLLLVMKVFYEGGTAVVVDPFREPPMELIDASIADGLPSRATWAPGGSAVCGYGRYAENSGLYVAEAPDWQMVNLLPEYELYGPGGAQGTVSGCSWLDDRRIVIASSHTGGADLSDVAVFDVLAGDMEVVATLQEEEHFMPFTHDIIGVPGGGFVVSQFGRRPEGIGDTRLAQPELVDMATGERRPILREGDWVVAVVQP